MNLVYFVAEKVTHPDHGEKDGGGTTNSLGWCDARELLGEIKAIDGHVQRGDDTVSPLRLLGFALHVQDAG